MGPQLDQVVVASISQLVHHLHCEVHTAELSLGREVMGLEVMDFREEGAVEDWVTWIMLHLLSIAAWQFEVFPKVRRMVPEEEEEHLRIDPEVAEVALQPHTQCMLAHPKPSTTFHHLQP